MQTIKLEITLDIRTNLLKRTTRKNPGLLKQVKFRFSLIYTDFFARKRPYKEWVELFSGKFAIYCFISSSQERRADKSWPKAKSSSPSRKSNLLSIELKSLQSTESAPLRCLRRTKTTLETIYHCFKLRKGVGGPRFDTSVVGFRTYCIIFLGSQLFFQLFNLPLSYLTIVW